ncbi:MAG: (2Fe-2S)-binding protein [Spirochaetales bacterium]|nr:(2Fe-2S)-binding protein [Spirochaetales bacterium]
MKWQRIPEDRVFRVNGKLMTVRVDPGETLLHVLRDGLGLTGPKAGCENGDCGACTVLLDGVPVKSCMVPAAECFDKEIVTVEGLEDRALTEAMLEESAFQCGYCASGFLVNLHALFDKHENPPKEVVDEWLASNLCRCTGYAGIRRGVERYMNKR